MIGCKKLFKSYNLKTWKQNKLQIFLSIIAIAIAAAILLSLRLILALNDSYTNINAKNINDGDINISLAVPQIGAEQLKVIEKLRDEGKIQYATTYKMQNNFTYGEIATVVYVKLIDSNYSCINKKIGSYADKLGKDRVLINRAAADKFNLKKGDTISLALKGFSNNDKSFRIEEVIDSTNSLDESLFGAIILNKSSFNSDEDGKNLATNINVIIKEKNDFEAIKGELTKSFDKRANIKTYKDAIEGNKNILDMESRASQFIEMVVIIITGIAEKNVIKEMDLYTIFKVSIIPLVLTVLFIIAQTMIFTIVPITISKEIKPNSILRQETQKFSISESYSFSIFKMIILMTLVFSIYIGSLKIGGIYLGVLLVLMIIVYELSICSIKLIVKIKPRKNKFLLLALRNIKRQKRKFAFCVTALVVTLILCGLIINVGNSIIPNMIKEFVYDSGYTLSLDTDFKGQNINNAERVLREEKSVKNYIKAIKTTGKFNSFKGKDLKEFAIHNSGNGNNSSRMESFINNIGVTAMDISKDMVNYNVMAGRWFTSKDVYKNYVVLGNNFAHSGIEANDEITFDIQGKAFSFKVLGICTRSNFRDNSGIYVDINTFKDNNFIDDSNAKLQYLIKCDMEKEKELSLSLAKKLKNSLIINERVFFVEVGKFMAQLTYVFIYICFISVFSALCLIGNILMIVNFERLMEFLILNVVGAKNRDIRKITILEGSIIGGVAGIVGCAICEAISCYILKELVQCEYSPSPVVDLIMIFVSMLLTSAASVMVINNMKLDRCSGLLRAD